MSKYIWVSAASVHPEDGKQVLCVGQNGGYYTAKYDREEKTWKRIGYKNKPASPIMWSQVPEKWESAKEKKPNDFERVLIKVRTGTVYVAEYREDDDSWRGVGIGMSAATRPVNWQRFEECDNWRR